MELTLLRIAVVNKLLLQGAILRKTIALREATTATRPQDRIVHLATALLRAQAGHIVLHHEALLPLDLQEDRAEAVVHLEVEDVNT